ncbi:MAG: shikimate dehydrogenase [Gammaproteobacteria bacterium]
MDRYAVIGSPVAHSYSPIIHAQFAAQTGQRLIYERIEAPRGDFAQRIGEFFGGCGRGLNVTRPHKIEAFRVSGETTPRASLAGAVNTLTATGDGRLQGDNTDGAGLVTDLLRNRKVTIDGRRLLVLGAGGAARGIAGPLLAERPSELVIANRNAKKAVELAARFAGHGVIRGCGYDALAGESFDTVINTTAASVAEDVPPVPMSALREDTLCYDLAYGQKPTPFTEWARERRMRRICKGWGMLVEQAAESFFVWRGVRPDTVPVLEKLEAWNRG